MEKKLIIPKKGVKVRDPNTGIHIPEEGAIRSINTYFDRRIKDGDLEVRDVPVEKPRAKNQGQKKDGDK